MPIDAREQLAGTRGLRDLQNNEANQQNQQDTIAAHSLICRVQSTHRARRDGVTRRCLGLSYRVTGGIAHGEIVWIPKLLGANARENTIERVETAELDRQLSRAFAADLDLDVRREQVGQLFFETRDIAPALFR